MGSNPGNNGVGFGVSLGWEIGARARKPRPPGPDVYPPGGPSPYLPMQPGGAPGGPPPPQPQWQPQPMPPAPMPPVPTDPYGGPG